jgi:hypothetical protein
MFMTFQRLMTVQISLCLNGMTALKLSGELKGRNTLVVRLKFYLMLVKLLIFNSEV